jgi:uncharacterized protein YkwD
MTSTRALSAVPRLVGALVATLMATVLVVTVLPGQAGAVQVRSQAAAAAYPAMSTSSYEKDVQRWINVQRGKHGLRHLRLASCTDRVAERWVSYLAAHDAFYHQSMSAILKECNARYAGETLGRGAISPRRLVRMWMNSPSHRDILLSKHPRRVGIGAYPDVYGQWVVAADFMRF